MDLEEALAQADVYAEETEVCMIDATTRTISVPAKYQLLGVENDKRVERIPFQCPKIVGDNKDLSQDFVLFINYVNANGDPDAYKIEDMQIDGDDITFSWLLEENVTLYQGNIQISFCGIIPGDEQDDSDKNRWGTTINTDCTVLTGLECTQQVAESNPDALAQIWAAIDELKAGGGGSGTPGQDGREIELQNSGTAIQWRYVGDNAWTDLVQLSELKGDPGDDGITPNIQIGTVQTLEPEQQATASMSGTPENPLLNLGIPKGEKGDPGEDAESGDSYTLPIMSDTQLGGGKAVSKTDEDVPVAVDPSTGQLFVPTYPESGSGASGITVKTMQNTDTAVTLPEETPYDLYIFPEMATLAVTIANENTDVHFFFDSGATATTFSLQAQGGGKIYTDAYSIDANMRYEVSVLNNVAYIKGVSMSEAQDDGDD